MHLVGTWEPETCELFGKRTKLVLELQEALCGGFADLVFERHNRVAEQLSHPLRCTSQEFHRRPLFSQGDAGHLERLIGLEGIDGLLAVDGDLAAGNL